MVEFCNSCGTSLPKGDLTIRNGAAFTSHDFHCPVCKQIANAGKETAPTAPEASGDADLVIRDGDAKSE